MRRAISANKLNAIQKTLQLSQYPIDSAITSALVSKLGSMVSPLPITLSSSEITPKLQNVVNAAGYRKVMMIGELVVKILLKRLVLSECTHGTEEFYFIRMELTKQMILQRQFNVVCIEADFSDVERVNRYVTLKPRDHMVDRSARECLGDFDRYPKWMWRNIITEEFIEWLRLHNAALQPEQRVEIFGIDFQHSIQVAIGRLVRFVRIHSQEDAEWIEHKYTGLLKYKDVNPQNYGMDVLFGRTKCCETSCMEVLLMMLDRSKTWLVAGVPRFDVFAAVQNARLIFSAEKYYRQLDSTESWNLRDTYMSETIESILVELEVHCGVVNPKLVVWAHNSHLGIVPQRPIKSVMIRGDSKASALADYGQYNVGTLMRERFGINSCFSVGFSTFNGTVTASSNWDGKTQTFVLNDGSKDSYAALFHAVAAQTGTSNFICLFDKSDKGLDLADALNSPRYERNIARCLSDTS